MTEATEQGVNQEVEPQFALNHSADRPGSADGPAPDRHGDELGRDRHGDELARDRHGDELGRDGHGDVLGRDRHGDELRPDRHGDELGRERDQGERDGGVFDLDHHGDAEVGEGLVDLAVNVRAGTPPGWLVDELARSLTDLASYPRQDAALAAVATRHNCEPATVLLTAGAAEAFVLIARAFRPRHAVVVHPQFTEPEAALRSAGHAVDRVVLRASDGFVLDPDLVPESADLVVIGNPTNPTSVLHPAKDLRALARPGRILVVDEAFMDAVPGEPESLVGADVPGLVVIRSLTKTWGLAGLRVGYVVAAPDLVGRLAEVQPQWPVSTPALAAAIACSSPRAVDEAERATLELDRQRQYLLDGLAVPAQGGRPVSVATYGVARGPFVLVQVRGATSVREALREQGYAVRRGDTFPGLDSEWLRIAVRPEVVTERFVKVWQDVLAGGQVVA